MIRSGFVVGRKIKKIHIDGQFAVEIVPRTKKPIVGSGRIRWGIRQNPITSDRNPTTSDRILSESVGILCTGFRQEVVGCRIRWFPTVGRCRKLSDPTENFIALSDISLCGTNAVCPHKDYVYSY